MNFERQKFVTSVNKALLYIQDYKKDSTDENFADLTLKLSLIGLVLQPIKKENDSIPEPFCLVVAVKANTPDYFLIPANQL